MQEVCFIPKYYIQNVVEQMLSILGRGNVFLHEVIFSDDCIVVFFEFFEFFGSSVHQDTSFSKILKKSKIKYLHRIQSFTATARILNSTDITAVGATREQLTNTADH